MIHPKEWNYFISRRPVGKKLQATVIQLGYELVVPPKKNFKEQRDYDKELYKRRNEIERLFRRLKLSDAFSLVTTS